MLRKVDFKNFIQNLLLLALVTGVGVAEAQLTSVGTITDPEHERPTDTALLQLGELHVAGNGCFRQADEEFPLVLAPGVLRIPLRAMIKKTSTTLARGACAFSLPVVVPENKKLVVTAISAEGDLNLARGVELTAQVELFQSGELGKILKKSILSDEKRLKLPFEIEKEQVLVETSCGESILLRGNTALLLKNKTETLAGRSTARMDYLDLAIELQDCE